MPPSSSVCGRPMPATMRSSSSSSCGSRSVACALIAYRARSLLRCGESASRAESALAAQSVRRRQGPRGQVWTRGLTPPSADAVFSKQSPCRGATWHGHQRTATVECGTHHRRRRRCAAAQPERSPSGRACGRSRQRRLLDVRQLRELALEVFVPLLLDSRLARLLAVARIDALRHVQPLDDLADRRKALLVEKEVRVLGPEVAKTSVPRELNSLTGSSAMRALRYLALTEQRMGGAISAQAQNGWVGRCGTWRSLSFTGRRKSDPSPKRKAAGEAVVRRVPDPHEQGRPQGRIGK
eukprot:3758802-Prymnesium_polylepis.1